MTGMTVALVQLAAHGAEQAEYALEAALAAVDRAAATHPDLIVLPECVYPAYFLRPWLDRGPDLAGLERARLAFAGRARRHACAVAVGLVESAGEHLYNTVFLIDRWGQLRGRARKHFLWHFDAEWFSPGTDFDVFDLELDGGGQVRLGMFVCADGRVPEVARILALRGAEVLIDATNWVTYGRDQESLSSPQAEFMMPTRALENRVHVVCANKVGLEQGSILYCGRSMVVGPDGRVLVQASPGREDILTCVLEPADAAGPIDGRLHPVQDRQPWAYAALGSEGLLQADTAHGRGVVFVACVQLDLDQPGSLERACRLVEVLEEQGAGLIVLGEPRRAEWEAASVLPAIGRALARADTLVAVTAEEQSGTHRYRSLFVCGRNGCRGSYRKVHLELDERDRFTAGDRFHVLDCGGFTLGAMIGYEALLPEPARAAMLGGAELVAWPRSPATAGHLHVARTRAAENRIFVAVADNLAHGVGQSAVADPAGRLLAPAVEGASMATLAPVLLSEARQKTIAPGTDLLRGRQPDRYRALFTV